MALLMVMAIVMLLTILVTEIVHGGRVRAQLAANQRDAVKAKALAFTGVQLHRLVLVFSKQLGDNPMVKEFGSAFGINGDSLWQMMPEINSKFLRLVFVSEGDKEDVKSFRQDEHLTDEQVAASREEFTSLHRNFLDFDGDFMSKVEDENRQFFVGQLGKGATDFATWSEKPDVREIYGLMLGEEHDEFFFDRNIERWDLVANLSDWTDNDTTRIYSGGYEDAIYQNLEVPYLPKNAPFDTLEEIRLVDGWHLDEIWDRFGQHLTIYGEGKVNVNTANVTVLEGLLRTYIEPTPYQESLDLLIEQLIEFRNIPADEAGGLFQKPEDFFNFIESIASGTVDPALKQAVSTNSTVFRVGSVGGVGDSTVKIDVIYDFDKSPIGKVMYWGIQ